MKKFISNDLKISRGTPESGFSVIELGVVLLLSMVLGALSIVGFQKSRTHYELTHTAQKIVWQIERARSLAIKYNQTISLGFTSSNTIFGIIQTNTTDADKATLLKGELPVLKLATGFTLSAYPTLTIKGNGTILSTSQTVMVNNGKGYQVPITIANSGRTTIGEVSKAGISY